SKPNVNGSKTRPRKPRWLAVHVFPVSRLTLGHPLDRRLQASDTGRFGLGLGDPLDILSLMTGTEFLEGGPRLRVAVQGICQDSGNGDFLWHLGLRPRRQ